MKLVQSHLESWTLFLRAPLLADTCHRFLRRLLEEFLALFHVIVDTDPEVDDEPLVSGSHSPQLRQLEAFVDEFTHFLCEGELRS